MIVNGCFMENSEETHILLILMTQNQPHQPISLKEINNDKDCPIKPS